MAFQVIDRSDPRFPHDMQIGPDRLARQMVEHARRVDEKEEFVKETVTISTGPKNTAVDVVVRYPRSAQVVEERDDLDNVVNRKRIWTNGRFIFAVYRDNEPWHKAARDEWEAAARNAIEKFAAVHSATITVGPRQEDTNRYNVMAECREAINAT